MLTSFRKSHSTIVPSIPCYAWAHFYNLYLNKTYENVAKVMEMFMQTDLSLCNLVQAVAISSVSCYSILTCELNLWQTAKICDPSLRCKHMWHCASVYQELQGNFTWPTINFNFSNSKLAMVGWRFLKIIIHEQLQDVLSKPKSNFCQWFQHCHNLWTCCIKSEGNALEQKENKNIENGCCIHTQHDGNYMNA